MFRIYAKINFFNAVWFFRYLKKYFKNESIFFRDTFLFENVDCFFLKLISCESNLSAIKLNIDQKRVSKKLFKKIEKLISRMPLFLTEVSFSDEDQRKASILKTFRVPIVCSGKVPKNISSNICVTRNFKERYQLNYYYVHHKLPFVDCEYASCAMKTIYIERKKCSICYKIKSNRLITPDNIRKYFMEDEHIFERIKSVVEKRDICKASCKYFELCKGGCFLNGDCGKENLKECNMIDESIFKNTNLYQEIKIKEDLE